MEYETDITELEKVLSATSSVSRTKELRIINIL